MSMTGKPKNRRITLTRNRRPSPEEEVKEGSYEIPRASKAEIRFLIEQEELGSTTEIASRLNLDGFPCAQADKWTAKLVDSALRRQDMSGLKEKLKENQGSSEDGLPASAVRQAAYDGAKQALEDLDLKEQFKLPEIPPLRVDSLNLKAAVAEATEVGLRQFKRDVEESRDGTVLKIHQNVKAALTNADLPGIKRVTEATGRNVGDIHKRIDALCDDVHDTVEGALKEHSKTVVDACEHMGATLYERVDQRFDKLEEALIQKLTAGMDIDLDEALGRVVDTRLKAHLDTVVNQFAVMLEGLKRELRPGNGKKGRG